MTIALLAKGWFNATSVYTCEVDGSQRWVFYGMLLIPLAVYAFMTIALFIAVLYFVIRNGMRTVVSQWRLFALSGYYTAIIITVLSIAYYQQENRKDVEAAVGKYVVCAAKFGAVSCKYNAPIPFALGFASIVLVISVGLVMSLLFWNRSTMAAWRYIIGRATGLYTVSDWHSGSADSVGSHSTNSIGTGVLTRSSRSGHSNL